MPRVVTLSTWVSPRCTVGAEVEPLVDEALAQTLDASVAAQNGGLRVGGRARSKALCGDAARALEHLQVM